jgi:magnesium-transporting ATPase (P-type)
MDTLVALGVTSAFLASTYGWLWPASGWPCYFNEPVMLLGFVLSGRFLEERARWRTGRAIEQLVELQPDAALLIVDGGPPRSVRVGALRPGDLLRLLPGDRMPVDGVVRDGCSTVDCSALTGENLPLRVEPGSELPAGSLNQEAPLELEVLRSGAHWHDLPERYGRWKTAHTRFSRWAKKGVWEQVFDELTRDRDNACLMLDSTLVRAHQQATAGRGSGPKRGALIRLWGVPEAD